RGDIGVETKADGTPVTIADRGAEEAVRRFLERECPGHGILGEEYPEKPGDGRYRWVLDPIDGTKSFIHHVPLWGTLIALERDGRPVVGVIACHAAGETISAAEGLGAELNGRPAHVSNVTGLAAATVSTTSYARLRERAPEGFDAICAGAGLSRAWGDCYGYLMVAAGRADVMLDPVMNHWDIAALVPVIREAGGTITGWDGEPEPSDSCVATNGHLQQAIIELLGGDLRGRGSDV
ncbi:MAG: inositol monophosphatase family protein, partial [Dehalococcoidia bacterium]